MKVLTKFFVSLIALSMPLMFYGCSTEPIPTVDLEEQMQAIQEASDALAELESQIDVTEAPTELLIEETEAPTEASTEAPTEAPTEVPTDNETGIRSEFQEAMDGYEEFMDEYVAFMNKYADSDGTDLGILADYAEFTGKYAEFTEDFAKWEDEEMSEEEAAYYLEVQTRVNKKLQEIA